MKLVQCKGATRSFSIFHCVKTKHEREDHFHRQHVYTDQGRQPLMAGSGGEVVASDGKQVAGKWWDIE